MNLIDLIDRARELIGGGGVDGLAENAAGQLSDLAGGEGNPLEKAQEALDGLAGDGGDAGDAGKSS